MSRAKPPRPPRHRPGEPFLKGPIPWAWIEAAAGLPGRALAVGLFLWHQAGCRRVRTVRLNLSRLPGGISRQAGRRGLESLERAGLVQIDRAPGRAPTVTLLDPTYDPGVPDGR